ncbi:MAG: DsrE family protein [Candidatus Verstraetearchaeota archaeon]|nr:DsrE family protein [Candidatus Verstraetearchaeota archaeon]
MPKLVIEISHSPFGHENAYAALFAAMAWASMGNEVAVVLKGEGVHVGRKGQVDPFKNISLPPTEKQVNELLEVDGRVVADRQALQKRGIKEETLIKGVEVLDPIEIRALIIEAGEKFLSF